MSERYDTTNDILVLQLANQIGMKITILQSSDAIHY